MILAEQCFLDMVNSPVRNIRARVELYNGSTLLNTFKYTDLLKELTIERVGEQNKFFGFGVCQKANIKVLDKDRKLNITTANTLDIAFGTGCDYIYPCPIFRVSEVHRDETTNELSITAYDALYFATAHTVSELILPASYSIEIFTTACASLLGIPLYIAADGFSIEYPNGANFEGKESIRAALNAVAEATQTIYFMDNEQRLTFRRLDVSGEAVYNITKDRYIDLDSGTNRRLANITHATELGDNVSASLAVAGTTQYVRDNPFWDMREDVGNLVDNALSVIGGLTINQFDCKWRGNFLLEIGDKISITTKENEEVFSYILDDVISYNGALSQKTQWKYTSDETETATNPSTLGDALKQTFARVDKANKEITLLVSETNNNTDSISSLLLNTESITASISKIEADTNSTIETINNDISNLTNRVEASITANDVSLQIQTELSNGVEKITTATGYTFDSDGLTVSKSGSEMTTQITEDGMTVNKNGEAVLTANNIGVNATNLHATTYLIVGNNSRFEDYGSRTGCFWIGEV